ncbi:hypothetical protein HUJ04_006435 [Dendroctonus ponderosae]|nr:hypothetical protein HUJ04_006435 [Dendroctonus ponderosae]KAH1012544.1 hypothetical protein HUJ05_011688 [Dendroctonus ponderosae]
MEDYCQSPVYVRADVVLIEQLKKLCKVVAKLQRNPKEIFLRVLKNLEKTPDHLWQILFLKFSACDNLRQSYLNMS